MDQDVLNSLSELNKNLKILQPKKSNIVVDMAAKIGTAVSTVGILALFALYTQDLPELKAEIEKLNWQQDLMRTEQQEFKKFMEKPRFTREDFSLEMRLYESRLALIEAELLNRKGFMVDTDERLRRLEKGLH